MSNNLFVIDDDVELTVLLQEFLSSHNYHISIFNNPLLAIDALLKKSHKISLLYTNLSPSWLQLKLL